MVPGVFPVTTTLTRRNLFAAAGPLIMRARAAQPRHNVLFFAVDDLRPDFGCYGNPMVHSPNMDKLALRGLLFTRAYCQQAVCSPSRTSLLTGRRPDTTRVYELQTHFRKNLPDIVTLPEHFKNNGYAATGLSKIYHNGLNDARSWTVPAWMPGDPPWGSRENAAKDARQNQRLIEQGLRIDARRKPGEKRGPAWDAPDVPDNALSDGKTAEEAVKALNAMRKDRFFLACGFLKPHLPFIAPRKYLDLYPENRIRLAPNPKPPRNAPPVALHDSGELRSYDDIPKEGPVPDGKALELIRAYYAAISYTDAQVGKVMGGLERLGLLGNTVVILWGDHGYHLGDQGLWNKHTCFEMATRVPMIVSVPGQKTAGRRTAALSEFVDIYPSLVDICGLPPAEGVEGTSFRPLLDNPGRPWKRAAFSQYPRGVRGVGESMGRSMRTERYRYTEWRVPGKDFLAVELYDHEKDPGEDVNVAGSAEYAAVQKELAAALQAGWRAAVPKS